MAIAMNLGTSAKTVSAVVILALAVSGCSMSSFKPAPSKASAAIAAFAPTKPGHVPKASAVPEAPTALGYAEVGNYDGLISHYSAQYSVPERLVRRVIARESNYNAGARNGPYYGLMQISHATASGMGYSGAPGGLLDAETNLRFAVKYLAGAYTTARGDEDQAMRFYARGFYYDAKRAGLLEEAGLR